jgi:chemotaxis protein methyltransferase CheR/type IV pilus assembly protein PilK
MGCSTGEEAYSLAIVIDQHLASLGAPYYLSVTATDISRSALTTARHGVYNRRKLIGMDPTIMQRYFVPMEQEQYQVSEALRQRVCFSQMNIVEDRHAALGEMDIIYCQNVLIYFTRSRRLDILNTLLKYLRPGGVLVLGPGEVTDWTNPRVERLPFENTLVYRRLLALNGQTSSMTAGGLSKECV